MNFKPKPVKVFTREDPCTKVHLTNCFYRGGQFVPRAMVEARGEIGLNAIKYLRREGYATVTTQGDVDVWALTEAGQHWLIAGLKRHLELHPADAALLVSQPSVNTRPRRRRTR